jgi:hypothetical protein
MAPFLPFLSRPRLPKLQHCSGDNSCLGPSTLLSATGDFLYSGLSCTALLALAGVLVGTKFILQTTGRLRSCVGDHQFCARTWFWLLHYPSFRLLETHGSAVALQIQFQVVFALRLCELPENPVWARFLCFSGTQIFQALDVMQIILTAAHHFSAEHLPRFVIRSQYVVFLCSMSHSGTVVKDVYHILCALKLMNVSD